MSTSEKGVVFQYQGEAFEKLRHEAATAVWRGIAMENISAGEMVVINPNNGQVFRAPGQDGRTFDQSEPGPA